MLLLCSLFYSPHILYDSTLAPLEVIHHDTLHPTSALPPALLHARVAPCLDPAPLLNHAKGTRRAR
jgi:hypothetical protein